MHNYITQSLACWKSAEWSTAKMEALFNAQGNGTILKMSLRHGNAVLQTGATAQPGRTEPIQAYFSQIAGRFPDLNLEFYICTADHPELVIEDDCPFFTFAKTINSRFIVIPDQFFTHDFSRYHRSSDHTSLDADVDSASQRAP